jgi:hypothetical protein
MDKLKAVFDFAKGMYDAGGWKRPAIIFAGLVVLALIVDAVTYVSGLFGG